MSRIVRDNGLSLVFLALFAVSLAGMSVVGLHDHNESASGRSDPPPLGAIPVEERHEPRRAPP
jgi:hypothetical protein